MNTKTIIATVGTSIVQNYLEVDVKIFYGDSYVNIKEYWEELENLGANQYKKKIQFVEEISDAIKKMWFSNIKKKGGGFEKNEGKNNPNASAEISSFIKLFNQLNDSEKFEIKLLYSDTLHSKIAAELLEEYLNSYYKDKVASVEKILIENLRVDKKDNFENGLKKFVAVFLKIINPNKSPLFLSNNNLKEINDKFIFVISGGYKALLPYITIFSMLSNIKMYYLFEKSNELLEVPSLPLGFDELFLERVYLDVTQRKNMELFNEESELLRLGIIDRNKKNLTAIGEFLRAYLEGQSSQAKNVFGFIAEYKLFEYFVHNPVQINGKSLKKVTRGVNIGKEIDIIMEHNNENIYCFAEVKALKAFISYNNKIIETLEKLLYKINDWYSPQTFEFHFYIYRIQKYLRNGIEAERKNAIINVINSIESSVKIRFFDVLFKENSYLKQQRENGRLEVSDYQLLVSSKVEPKDIKEIIV